MIMVAESEQHNRRFREEVERSQERKLRRRRESMRGRFWLGLSMFGLIGWSVVIPTLLLTALGVWLDSRYVTDISWTLTGVFVGVILGCLNAWYWISRESKRQ